MKKKIVVVGRGTAGAQAIAHFARWGENMELEWCYDPDIPTQSVGEGSTLILPKNLFENLNFNFSDLKKINGNFKTGIYKKNWGEQGKEFFHNFMPPATSIHFSAVELQDYVHSQLKNKVNIVEKKVDVNDIDADHIMDCSGKPENYDDFYISEYIPVNSVHVVQCDWDYPRFDYSLTIARPYGWVFGIPLQNRCSIGYLFNNKINNLAEIQEDMKSIFEDYKLQPSSKTNTLSFESYWRKTNFSNKIVYNGNKSFFLEPLEATSISVMDNIQRMAFDTWTNDNVVDPANISYNNLMEEIETFIMMHYFSGSTFNTEFWKFAKERGIKCMEKSKNNLHFLDMCKQSLNYKPGNNMQVFPFGQWTENSFYENLHGLGIEKDLIEFLEK